MPGFIKRFRFDTAAAAALELAIVGPVFLLLLFAILGVGLDGFYQLSLDEAVRNAARQVQMEQPAAFSGPAFIASVCREFAAIGANCSNTVTYDVQASQPYTITNGVATGGWSALTPASLSANGTLPNTIYIGPTPVNANGTANTNYVDGVDYLIQVAYPLPFKIPFVSTAITDTGTGSILATATVTGEPY